MFATVQMIVRGPATIDRTYADTAASRTSERPAPKVMDEVTRRTAALGLAALAVGSQLSCDTTQQVGSAVGWIGCSQASIPPASGRSGLCRIVGIEGDKVSYEHILWDQANVLVQIGLLDPAGRPVTGAGAAAKLRNPALPDPFFNEG